MKVVGVIQYEPEVPYFKHCFSFKIYYTRSTNTSTHFNSEIVKMMLYIRVIVHENISNGFQHIERT